jgi:hypothetical protein
VAAEPGREGGDAVGGHDGFDSWGPGRTAVMNCSDGVDHLVGEDVKLKGDAVVTGRSRVAFQRRRGLRTRGMFNTFNVQVKSFGLLIDPPDLTRRVSETPRIGKSFYLLLSLVLNPIYPFRS